MNCSAAPLIGFMSDALGRQLDRLPLALSLDELVIEFIRPTAGPPSPLPLHRLGEWPLTLWWRANERASERAIEGTTERPSERATERASERPSERAIEDDHNSSSGRPFDTLISAL